MGDIAFVNKQTINQPLYPTRRLATGIYDRPIEIHVSIQYKTYPMTFSQINQEDGMKSQ
jgi:hypothetical protein